MMKRDGQRRQGALNLGNDKEEQGSWRHKPEATGRSHGSLREDGEKKKEDNGFPVWRGHR